VKHAGVEVSFGMLAFSFVGVLVATQGLRSGKVSATVMALESAGGFGVSCDGGVMGGCVGGFGKVLAEETNGLVFIFGGRGAEKGELREGVDVHEVMDEVVGGGVVHVEKEKEKEKD